MSIDQVLANLPAPTRVRPGIRNPEAEAILLGALKQGHLVKDACAFAGISRMTVTVWRRRDPRFAARYDDAIRTGNVAVTRARRVKLVQA